MGGIGLAASVLVSRPEAPVPDVFGGPSVSGAPRPFRGGGGFRFSGRVELLLVGDGKMVVPIDEHGHSQGTIGFLDGAAGRVPHVTPRV